MFVVRVSINVCFSMGCISIYQQNDPGLQIYAQFPRHINANQAKQSAGKLWHLGRLDLKRKLQLKIADVMWQQRKFSFLSMLGTYHLTINQMDEHSGQQIVDQLLLKLSTVYLFFIHKSYGRQCGSMDFMGCSMRMRSDIYCGWSNMHFCVLGWRSLLDHALYCSMSKEKEKNSNNFAHVCFQMLFL